MNEDMNKEELIKALDDLVDCTLKMCKNDITTKDGYGSMMGILGKFNNKLAQKNFLLLCVAKGYPKDTAASVMRIMGLV